MEKFWESFVLFRETSMLIRTLTTLSLAAMLIACGGGSSSSNNNNNGGGGGTVDDNGGVRNLQRNIYLYDPGGLHFHGDRIIYSRYCCWGANHGHCNDKPTVGFACGYTDLSGHRASQCSWRGGESWRINHGINQWSFHGRDQAKDRSSSSRFTRWRVSRCLR